MRLRDEHSSVTTLISYMNHELRGSINIFSGYTSMVLDEWYGPLSDEQKQVLAVASDAGKTLLRQVESVVELCRLEFHVPAPDFRRFDPAEAVAEAAASYEAAASAKGIRLRLSGESFCLRTDRKMLVECLAELLDNAVKYTEKGEILMIWNQSVDGAEITVTDTGVGMTEDETGKLFRTYVRFQYAVRNRIPGTGLGLYLLAKKIRILGGAVSLTSVAGEGTSVTLRIPVANAEGMP